jgi:hypothetical protein
MVRVFDSTSKKLAIPLFGLFELGWIVSTAGIHDIIFDDNFIKSLVYMIPVVGQFVVVLGLLHAALPSGTPSSIIGALSTILNTIYFISIGYMITVSFFIILLFKLGKYYPKESDFQLQDVDQKLVVKVASLILAGSIMLVVSWSLVQFASFFDL